PAAQSRSLVKPTQGWDGLRYGQGDSCFLSISQSACADRQSRHTKGRRALTTATAVAVGASTGGLHRGCAAAFASYKVTAQSLSTREPSGPSSLLGRVTSMLPSWDRTKTTSKKGFDKVWGWADKLGAPVNRFTNRIGSEAFWPTTLDKESDKAARILRSFCKDGFYTEEERPTNQDGPKQKQKVLKKIPEKVIQNCVGLAVFTVMRTGLWISGAGGSGVLIAKKEDGTWSPPSGILLHTAGLGFLVGVDIYDCVLVINNRKALESFTRIRATLGGEVSVAAGPVGAGGVLENDGKWKQANVPVFTYMKSRGFYAGIQVDGTIMIERTDENERFYGQKLPAIDILAGKVRHAPPEIKMLMETLKAAEGRTDVDMALMEELEGQPAPGDVDLDAPGSGKSFGVPDPDDPDPFGVLALQNQGLEIREAGTHSRPSSQQFEYNPSPTSPIYNKFHRRSIDTVGSTSNRESYLSTKSSRARWSSERPSYTTSEMGTQTDEVITPITSPVSANFGQKKIEEEDEEPADVDYTKIDLGPYSNMNGNQDFDGTTMVDQGTSFSPVKPEFEEVDLKGAERKLSADETLSPDWGSEVKTEEEKEKEDKEDYFESEHAKKTEDVDEEKKEEQSEKIHSKGTTNHLNGDHAHVSAPPEKEDGDKFHSVPGTPNEFE
ncbi:hypothetical protein DH86_00001314, partial [Scytalidium sp. 3C]